MLVAGVVYIRHVSAWKYCN